MPLTVKIQMRVFKRKKQKNNLALNMTTEVLQISHTSDCIEILYLNQQQKKQYKNFHSQMNTIILRIAGQHYNRLATAFVEHSVELADGKYRLPFQQTHSGF